MAKKIKISKGHSRNLFILGGFVIFMLIVAYISISNIGGGSSNVGAVASSVSAPEKLHSKNNHKDPEVKKLIKKENDIAAKGKDTFAPVTVTDIIPKTAQKDTAPYTPVDYYPPEPQPVVVHGIADNPMNAEMDGLLNKWLPVMPKKKVFAEAKAKSVLAAASPGTAAGAAPAPSGTTPTPPPVIPDIRAGTILYAEVVTSVNSDEPGPVLFTGLSREIRGMRIMANGYTAHELSLTINPSTLVTPVGTVAIDSYAINPDTARTVVKSAVDRHFFQRWGSFLLTSVLSDIGTVMGQLGTQTQSVTAGLGTTQTTNTILSTSQEGWVIAGKTAQRIAGVMGNYINRPNTVYLHSGETVGILFMKDVVFPKSKKK